MKSDSNIIIKEVINSDELKKFVMFPHSLYKDSKYWVAPIIKEELEVLNKETNPVFNNAIAHYFLAYNDGEIVGRIAALINWIEVKNLKKKKVRFGWFDFIDDQNVSKALLEKVIEIGKKKFESRFNFNREHFFFHFGLAKIFELGQNEKKILIKI